MKVKIAVPNSPEWEMAVALVRKKYGESFNAVVDPNPDRFFVCLSDDEDGAEARVLACVGITLAANRTQLFSERYLDAPIEQVISEREERAIRRDTLIEVGSLAATGFGAAAELVRVLPVLAWCMGTEYVVTTATARVRGLCEKTGIYFLPLCLADPNRLSDASRQNWGAYYQDQPITGYIGIAELSRTFFADNTGRYDLGGLILDVPKAQSRVKRIPTMIPRPVPTDAEITVMSATSLA